MATYTTFFGAQERKDYKIYSFGQALLRQGVLYGILLYLFLASTLQYIWTITLPLYLYFKVSKLIIIA